MDRRDREGACDACGHRFGYHLIHGGFNDSTFGYCRDCGLTAILDVYQAPTGVDTRIGEPLLADTESLLAPCRCGGAFSGRAAPRCPRCRHELSAEAATAWIEAHAPGAALGWRWQRTWQGLYCIVIEDRVVLDSWRPQSP